MNQTPFTSSVDRDQLDSLNETCELFNDYEQVLEDFLAQDDDQEMIHLLSDVGMQGHLQSNALHGLRTTQTQTISRSTSLTTLRCEFPKPRPFVPHSLHHNQALWGLISNPLSQSSNYYPQENAVTMTLWSSLLIFDFKIQFLKCAQHLRMFELPQAYIKPKCLHC